MEALTSIQLPPRVSQAKPDSVAQKQTEPKVKATQPADGDGTGTTTEPLQRVEEVLNSALGSQTLPNSRLEISVHDDTGRFIYRAVHKDTGEVLHQYPADEVLRQLAYYRNLEGIVVDETA